ncbi:MAG: flagellar motor switch protein FliM [Pedosphaera sp.]|nr:flagellar motor switch protein FliM [Pedosphaera sp.]
MEASTNFSDEKEVLSQSDVERLLAQVSEQESNITVHKEGSGSSQKSKDTIQPYDFRNPVFLSSGELRKLRLRHEEYIRALAARLSIYLRLDFTLQMSKLQTIPYQKFIESLSNPTHLTMFRVEPLRGVFLLDVHPRLGLTIVDRLMGGPAHSVNADHDMSEIEMALLDQTVQLVMSEWCSHWSKIQDLRPTLLGHETNGRFLQTAAHDTVMLVLSIEARIGDCMEAMQIAFPYYALEPMLRQMSLTIDTVIDEGAKPARTVAKWSRDFDDVHVPIVAEWRGLELTAREITQLKVGDVVELDPDCSSQVVVRLANMPKFSARLGTKGNKWAVELAGKFKS